MDEYLASLRKDRRAALQTLRKTIRAVVPEADECISYRLPAFKLGGKGLVAFGAAQRHCSFYLMSSTVLAGFREELKGYEIRAGTIHFQPESPLPASIVRKLVKARIAENDG